MNENDNLVGMELESALDQLPLTPPPPHFTANVMAQVRTIELPGPATAVQFRPFRLNFLEIAVSFFTTLFMAFTFALIGWLNGSLTLNWLPEIQFASESIVTGLPGGELPAILPWISAGVIVILGELALLAWVALQIWWDQPLTTSTNGLL